jgi:hypothetical protein
MIQLSAKTNNEVYDLISNNKYLTYFVEHPKLHYRVRAKKQMRKFLNEKENDMFISKILSSI